MYAYSDEKVIPCSTSKKAAEAANVLQKYLESCENKSQVNYDHRLNEFTKYDKQKKFK